MSSNAAGDGETALSVGMTVRFVVLHHTGVEEPHFDLMLEVPGREKLLTWRLGVSPEAWAEAEGGEMGAVRIGDHRKAYMTYEGKISGGRGEVLRVAQGAVEIVAVTDTQALLQRVGGGWTAVVPLKTNA